MGDRHGEALVLGSSADAHRQLGGYDRAIELRKLAHELICEVGMRGDVCSSLNQLAAAYCDVEQFTLARASYEQALEFAVELGETHQEARALAGLGTLLQHDDPPAARELLTRALRLFESISQPDAERMRQQLTQLAAG